MKSLWKLANAIHLGLYRLTSGRIGGRIGDGTILLLTTTGRKTGKARTVPVLYFLDDNGNPVVTASNAGLPKNPAWFENLRVNPRVTYQIGAERKIARADIAPPELRDRLWTRLTTNFKGFVEYQKKTTRVRLRRPRLYLLSNFWGCLRLSVVQCTHWRARYRSTGGHPHCKFRHRRYCPREQTHGRFCAG